MSDSIRGILTDGNGKVIVGASVQVNKTGTSNPASLFSDPFLVSAATNPLTTDANGAYGPVFAATGRYDLVFTAAGYTFIAADATVESVLNPFRNAYVTGTYTVDDRDVLIYANAAGGPVTINLPDLGTILQPNREIRIIKYDSSVNTVTIVPSGAQTINGASSIVLSSQYARLSIIANTGIPAWLATTSSSSTAPGLINIQYLTGGTTYTPTPGTTKILLEMLGGGGGGGGNILTGTSVAAAGGGGASGTYVRKFFSNITGAATYAYTIGTFGGGGAGNAAGSSGGNTTFTGPGALVVTAPGGGGGQPGTAVASAITLGGVPVPSTNGDLVQTIGTPGEDGLVLSATVFKGGNGASNLFGSGGQGAKTTTAGASAQGFGTGGAGASSAASQAAQNGGNGTSGLIIVWEFS